MSPFETRLWVFDVRESRPITTVSSDGLGVGLTIMLGDSLDRG